MDKLKHITILLLLVVVMAASAAPAKEASVLLQEGLYAEEIDGDLDAAIQIYEKVIQDKSAQRSHVAQALYRQGMCYLKKQREQQAKMAFEKLISEYSDQTKVVNKAKPLLQDLGNADPAALMPSDTLLYLELGSPGKQIETILNMLKGTPLENPLAAIGAPQTGMSQGNIVQRFLNPSMMAELKKIRGAGVGITGVAKDNPPVVVVLYPGKSDALRGLIAGGLALVAKPVESIEGMQTVEFNDGGGAAYDDTVVILASPKAYEAGQLTWCVKQYKGIGKEPTLASSNKSFSKINEKDRQGNAFTVWANFDKLYTDLMSVLPAEQLPEELLKANALADFAHIDDLIAYVSLKEDGIAVEANVDFKDGYSGLAYNMFRTPKLSKAALEVIPSDAIGLISIAWGGADSPQSYAIREQIRKAAGINLGGDIFANVEQITLFAIPSTDTIPGPLADAPPIVGSLGLALKSQRPQDTRRILTGVLTAANLIASQSAEEDPEKKFGKYQLNLVNDITIHCYTDQKSETTVLSLSPNVIGASASALGRRQSTAAGEPIENALSTLSPDISKLVLVNVGKAIRTGGDMFIADMDEPEFDLKQLIDQLAKSCEKTTVQFRTREQADSFNVRLELRDLPPADEFFAPMMKLSEMVDQAKKKAWSEKKVSSILANIRKTSRPIVIDGRAEGLWSEARQYKISNVVYSPISSNEDCSASYKAMWDAEHLYLLVNVTDDHLKNDSSDDWLDDSVEVFIDADNSKSGSYDDNDYQFFFNWDRDDPELGESRGRTGNVDFAVQTKDDGYQMEIKFPWSSLGTEPSAGMKIGLDVHVNDDDDGGERDTKLMWRDKNDSAWENTKDFGIAELSGLIAWWKLDETSGRDVADASGNGNIGKILNGQPRWQTSAGKIGGALLLDGKGDWIHVANESNFDCVSEVTVAAWIKVNRFDKDWQAVVTKGDSAWRIQRNASTDTLEFACTGLKVPGDNQYGALFGRMNINDGKWHHVAGVYDGRNMVIYVDGRMDVSQSASGSINTNDHPVYIGENAEMNGRFWNGLIDDVRVYNYGLDQDQVEALYNKGK